MSEPASSSLDALKQCDNCHKTGTPLSVCGRCHSVRYCTSICQREHWSTGPHKQQCSVLAAQHRQAKGQADLAKDLEVWVQNNLSTLKTLCSRALQLFSEESQGHTHQVLLHIERNPKARHRFVVKHVELCSDETMSAALQPEQKAFLESSLARVVEEMGMQPDQGVTTVMYIQCGEMISTQTCGFLPDSEAVHLPMEQIMAALDAATCPCCKAS